MKYLEDITFSGFSYDNYNRNQFLKQNNLVSEQSPVKTGTTIAGMIFKVPYFQIFRMVLS